MPNTSVDLELPDPSLVDVFGPLPTRYERGKPPVGIRKTQYRQLSRDYAPVEKLELTSQELAVFSMYGLGDVVKFRASGTGFEGEYFWFPNEPDYTIHDAHNALGLGNIVISAQAHMISNSVFIPRNKVYNHPVLQSYWDEVFGAMFE